MRPCLNGFRVGMWCEAEKYWLFCVGTLFVLGRGVSPHKGWGNCQISGSVDRVLGKSLDWFLILSLAHSVLVQSSKVEAGNDHEQGGALLVWALPKENSAIFWHSGVLSNEEEESGSARCASRRVFSPVQRQCSAVLIRSIMGLLKGEIYVRAKGNRLQSQGLWFWLL